MSICSKCKIDKPADQFYTYWHSTQKKHRTRRICFDCVNEQKKEYRLKIKEEKDKLIEVSIPTEIIQPDEPELIVEDFENNPDYKYCPECETYKILSEFYKSNQTGKLFKKCKACHNINVKEASRLYWDEKRRTIGCERVSVKPNTYLDEVQKEQTFWLMELLGWTYNDNGVWSKEGIKDKDKNWPNLKCKKKNFKTKPIGVKKEIDINKVIQLINNGWSYKSICEKLDCSKPTLMKRLNEYYRNEKN